MIHNPILSAVRRSSKRRVSNTIRLFTRVLVEDGVRMFAPVTRVHRVVAYKLQLAETVVTVIRPRGAVDEEGLVGDWIDQLLGSFV